MRAWILLFLLAGCFDADPPEGATPDSDPEPTIGQAVNASAVRHIAFHREVPVLDTLRPTLCSAGVLPALVFTGNHTLSQAVQIRLDWEGDGTPDVDLVGQGRPPDRNLTTGPNWLVARYASEHPIEGDLADGQHRYWSVVVEWPDTVDLKVWTRYIIEPWGAPIPDVDSVPKVDCQVP